MFLTDTHAHIHMPPLSENIKEIVSRGAERGVKRIITIGVNLTDSFEALKTAEKFPSVYAAVGVHPQDAESWDDKDYDKLLEAGSNKKVIAIGEIGMDLYRNPVPKDIQERVFRSMLSISKELKKPVCIHNRDAGSDCMRIMSEELRGGNSYGGILHCFDGDKNIMKWALDNGFNISYAGQVTYKSAGNIRETLKLVPTNRIFIETDCPYLAPVPLRGKVNEPANVDYTAMFISGELGIDMENFADILEKNFIEFFGGLI